MSENMGAKIKKLRIEQNLTLEEVAKIVGVGKSTVRKWETGMISNMRRDKLPLLAEALRTSPSYLLGYYEGENPLVDFSQNQQIRLYELIESKCKDLGIPYSSLSQSTDVSSVVLQKIQKGICFSLRAADIKRLFHVFSFSDSDAYYIATGSDDYYSPDCPPFNVYSLIENGRELDVSSQKKTPETEKPATLGDELFDKFSKLSAKDQALVRSTMLSMIDQLLNAQSDS